MAQCHRRRQDDDRHARPAHPSLRHRDRTAAERGSLPVNGSDHIVGPTAGGARPTGGRRPAKGRVIFAARHHNSELVAAEFVSAFSSTAAQKRTFENRGLGPAADTRAPYRERDFAPAPVRQEFLFLLARILERDQLGFIAAKIVSYRPSRSAHRRGRSRSRRTSLRGCSPCSRSCITSATYASSGMARGSDAC